MTEDYDFFLTQAEALRVIMATNPAKPGVSVDQLIVGVHAAAVSYAFAERNPRPDPAARVADMEELAGACRTVLVALGIAPADASAGRVARKPVEWRSLKRTLGAGALVTAGPAALDAIRGVQDLEAWADDLSARYRRKLDQAEPQAKKRAGRRPRAALGTLFGALENVYFVVFEDMPALARSSGRGDWREALEVVDSGGVLAAMYEKGTELPVRFLRFLCELLPLLADRGLGAVPITDTGIEQAVRRWRKRQEREESPESIQVLGKRLEAQFRALTK